jgi:hypothetical protein
MLVCRNFSTSLLHITTSLPLHRCKFAATYSHNYCNKSNKLSFQFISGKLEV